MPLPKPKPWATDMRSYWAVNIPTAVNGVVPQWGAMKNKVAEAYRLGKPVTYFDGSHIYYMALMTSTNFIFYGRLIPNYPDSSHARMYIQYINRSSGTVTWHAITLSQTAFA